MQFLCPACRTALPRTDGAVVPCTACGVQVDLTRLDTAPGVAPLRPDVDLAGETIAEFKLLKRLGAGGMGIVYEAEGPVGKCAVKVLGALLASDPALRQRFRREAAALEAIRHPNVVRVIGGGEERGFCWYAMELVEGADLRTKLAKGPLAPKEVETLSRALLGALSEVHERGFVHRDVKPGNVLLTKDGAAKLCDFGIARHDGATTLTESAAILGSLRYMAPEQRLGRAGPPADLYALGVTLHEALAGGVPDETPLPSSTPRHLRRMVEALCAPRAVERPASAAAALAMLDRRFSPRIAIAAGLVVVLGASLAVALRPAAKPEPLPKKGVAVTEPAEKKDDPFPLPPDSALGNAPNAAVYGQQVQQAIDEQKLKPLFDNTEPPKQAAKKAPNAPTKKAVENAPAFEPETVKNAPTANRKALQVDQNDAFTSKLTMPGSLGTRGTTAVQRKEEWLKTQRAQKKFDPELLKELDDSAAESQLGGKSRQMK